MEKNPSLVHQEVSCEMKVGGARGVRAPQPPNCPCPTLTPPAFDQIGGYGQLEAAYARAIPSRTIANTTCHLPRADAMHMFRDPHTGDLPWTGMTFGLTIMATWYWCTDQVIVQRSLSARDLNHAKAGSILASYLKMLPMGLIIMPGMISRALFPGRTGSGH